MKILKTIMNELKDLDIRDNVAIALLVAFYGFGDLITTYLCIGKLGINLEMNVIMQLIVNHLGYSYLWFIIVKAFAVLLVILGFKLCHKVNLFYTSYALILSLSSLGIIITLSNLIVYLMEISLLENSYTMLIIICSVMMILGILLDFANLYYLQKSSN